jgi:hypothetical protein
MQLVRNRTILHDATPHPSKLQKTKKVIGLKMVEAAGVEPASEIHVSKETPCVVDSGDFALRAQNRQDARNASPMISSLRLGPRPRNQPAVRRSSATHRRSHGERLLI